MHCACACPCSAASLYHTARLFVVLFNTFAYVVHDTKGVLRWCKAPLCCNSEPLDCLIVILVNTFTNGVSAPNSVCATRVCRSGDVLCTSFHNALCFACGQMHCGACNANVSATAKCPTCRASLHVAETEDLHRNFSS